MKLIWLIIAIVFAIGEMLTASLALIWFSVGAIALIFISSFVENVTLQVLIFAIISITLLVFFTKKIVKKDKDYKYETNLQGIISKKGIVKEKIVPNKIGIVILENEEWSAISYNNKEIEKDVVVEIIKIEGVKLVVRPVFSE